MSLGLRQWPNTASRAARKLVSSVIASQSTPITTQQLYKLVVQEEYKAAGRTPPHIGHAQNTSTKPPHPSNIIRSMSYMKNVVLQDLLERKEVQKVHTIRTLSKEEIEMRLKSMTKAARRNAEVATTADTWLWKPRTPPAKVEPKPPKPRFGIEVGVEEDWSHLNKRRQRAREASVARDVAWVRQLESARKEGQSATVST
ncbi:hypothetical protein BXZ70DRAFT_910651 [Cristinia sonorae]|uniref:Uncharacterized protein n=1 Tax=Cristinia sonorae TaxID=1940300 RepID=A0A8K0UH24_9AGAR|nr:hypothetical protein BXZ70DRAFT_910651 [Cristinia sonorae]